MATVELLGTFGDDLMVVNAARISYDRWSDQITAKDKRLIEHLASQGHKSPFYHPQAQFRISAPFYVAAQLKRHHIGLAINEVSRRYTSGEPEFDVPTEWRHIGGASNPQISGDAFEDSERAEIVSIASRAVGNAQGVYEALLARGVAPEQARVVLPVCTITTWLWTGSLFAYANLCLERLAPDAQPETRAVAQLIADHMAEAFPVSWAALVEKVYA